MKITEIFCNISLCFFRGVFNSKSMNVRLILDSLCVGDSNTGQFLLVDYLKSKCS